MACAPGAFADNLSFRAAASRLGVTPSALSHERGQISKVGAAHC
jgi:hypothetical protein